MLTKSQPEEIQDFLSDASYVQGGHATRVGFPRTGEVIDLRRGELHAGTDGQIAIPLPSGRLIEAQLPSYQMPQVRKHTSGYYVAPGMDVIDLFIGSEGTLGVVVEIEVKLLPKPEGLLSGVVFFKSEADLLAFVREARERSLANRGISPTVREGNADRGTSPTPGPPAGQPGW